MVQGVTAERRRCDPALVQAYLQLVCADGFMRGGAVAHGGQAGGAPGDQQRSAGHQLGHQAHPWSHVAQVRTERHAGTGGHGGRDGERGLRGGGREGGTSEACVIGTYKAYCNSMC